MNEIMRAQHNRGKFAIFAFEFPLVLDRMGIWNDAVTRRILIGLDRCGSTRNFEHAGYDGVPGFVDRGVLAIIRHGWVAIWSLREQAEIWASWRMVPR